MKTLSIVYTTLIISLHDLIKPKLADAIKQSHQRTEVHSVKANRDLVAAFDKLTTDAIKAITFNQCRRFHHDYILFYQEVMARSDFTDEFKLIVKRGLKLLRLALEGRSNRISGSVGDIVRLKKQEWITSQYDNLKTRDLIKKPYLDDYYNQFFQVSPLGGWMNALTIYLSRG